MRYYIRPLRYVTPPASAGYAGPAGVIPAGANFTVRTIDGIDSQTAHPGQTFAASLDQPVMVNGETLIPRGADVVVKLVNSKASGRLTGRAELTREGDSGCTESSPTRRCHVR